MKLYAAEEWRTLVLSAPNLPDTKLPEAYQKNTSKHLITPSIERMINQIVEETITTQLINANVEVIDKTLLLSEKKGQDYFNNAELSTDHQLYLMEHDDINLAVRYRMTIYQNSHGINTAGSQWQLTLSSYFVDLETKNKIETYNDKRSFNLALKNCHSDCLSNWLSKNAKNMAQDMGVILVEKLQSLPRRYRYELAFHDFLNAELIAIHRYLTRAKSFISATLIRELDTKHTLIHQTSGRQYRYVSLLAADEIDVLLQQYFESNHLSVNQTSLKSRKFVYKRVEMPYFFLYCAVFFIFVLLVSILLSALYKVSTKMKQDKAALKVIDHKKSTKMLRKAEVMIANAQYQQALTIVEDVLVIDESNQSAERLKLTLLNFIQGEQHFNFAQQAKGKDPGKALKLCAQAKALTPSLASKVSILRDEINSHSKPIKGAVIGTLGLSTHFIFVNGKIELGRKVTDFQHSFAINYQRISRVGKQCEFVRQNKEYFLIDQGSSNGTVLNGVPLSVNKLAKLSDKSTVLIGGDINQPHSLCQLDCKVIGDHSPALNITVNSHASALMNGFDTNKNIKHAWPSMDVDFLTHWTLMSNEINLGLNKQGNIDLGCVEGGEVLAKLIYDDGFYLAPVIEVMPTDSPIIELILNNQIVYSRMPLQNGFVASLNGCLFSFKANT